MTGKSISVCLVLASNKLMSYRGNYVLRQRLLLFSTVFSYEGSEYFYKLYFSWDSLTVRRMKAPRMKGPRCFLSLAALRSRSCCVPERVILILTVAANRTCVHTQKPVICCLWSRTEHNAVRALQEVPRLAIIFPDILPQVKLLLSLLWLVRFLFSMPFKNVRGNWPPGSEGGSLLATAPRWEISCLLQRTGVG